MEYLNLSEKNWNSMANNRLELIKHNRPLDMSNLTGCLQIGNVNGLSFEIKFHEILVGRYKSSVRSFSTSILNIRDNSNLYIFCIYPCR